MVRIFSYHDGSKYQSYRGNAGFNGGKGGGAPKINVAKSLSPSSDPGGLVTRLVDILVPVIEDYRKVMDEAAKPRAENAAKILQGIPKIRTRRAISKRHADGNTFSVAAFNILDASVSFSAADFESKSISDVERLIKKIGAPGVEKQLKTFDKILQVPPAEPRHKYNILQEKTKKNVGSLIAYPALQLTLLGYVEPDLAALATSGGKGSITDHVKACESNIKEFEEATAERLKGEIERKVGEYKKMAIWGVLKIGACSKPNSLCALQKW
ncbi:hypothetical protein F4823DRAFT_640005 [Ustulina deusta]|nr:hypothetical protein F4823DRAFT_640005 [Ustulina deusta]